MATLTTDTFGRLIAYTYSELSLYKWNQIGTLAYGINRAFLGAERSAEARKNRLAKTQTSFEKIEIVSYAALETAINNLNAAVDSLLADLD